MLMLAGYYGYAQKLIWKFEAGSPIHTSPVLSGKSLYLASENGSLSRLDVLTGIVQWQVKPGGPLGADPVTDGKMVWVNSRDGFLYAVSAEDGKVVWKFRTGGEKVYDAWDYHLSAPVVAGDGLFFGSGDGFVYALNKNTGRMLWKFKTGDVVHASPVIFDNKVYIGSFDGFLYVLDTKTGKPAWKFDTVGDTYFPRGEIQKAVSIQDSSVYFGSRDYNIYVLDAAKGTGKWNMKEKGSWIIATPVVDSSQVFFGTSDSHYFYAMDAQNGDIHWKIPLNMRVFGSPAIDGNMLYFGCFNGKLYAADRKTGKVQWMFQTDGSKANYEKVYNREDKFREDFEVYGNDYLKAEKKIMDMGAILATPVWRDGRIYFTSTDGHLYVLDARDK